MSEVFRSIVAELPQLVPWACAMVTCILVFKRKPKHVRIRLANIAEYDAEY